VDSTSGSSTPYPAVVGAVKYQEIRDRIQTGDILLFSGRRWLSHVIEGISHSRYSHVAFLTRWEGRIIAMQADLRGVEVIPASMLVCRYEGNVEWWRLGEAHRLRFNGRDFLDRALTLIGIKYGYLSLLWLGLRMLLGLSVYRKFSHLRPSTLYCSQFVSYCYKNEGLDINAKAGVDGTSPSDFALSGLFTEPYQLYDGSDHQACEEILVTTASGRKTHKKAGQTGSFWNGKERSDARVRSPGPAPAPPPSPPPASGS
jgi:hypothetical protein